MYKVKAEWLEWVYWDVWGVEREGPDVHEKVDGDDIN